MKTICEAVKFRITALLEERKMTQYRLEQNSDVAHGIMNGIMLLRNKSVDLMTVVKIAGGFDMTVAEFLDDKLFNEDNLRVT